MAWPSSPDLNPIEHFWDQLQRKLNNAQDQELPQNCVRPLIINAWYNNPRDATNRLIHCMRRRCQAVINVHGGHTPY
ncbi:hypothetical protein V1264_022888 [Littorina saxatilis]|uniref:Tc1-like transposase DDE domain-containing protein n=1 Tax=Littorina saxatilis TaxID=31220 RepID=A0AAN9B5U2_9CAEN